ncbi:MAG: hypothetical protein ACHQXG_02165 [Nitrososphaerales archaeon]
MSNKIYNDLESGAWNQPIFGKEKLLEGATSTRPPPVVKTIL